MPSAGSGVSPASEGGRESRGSGGPVRGSPDPLALAERAENSARCCKERTGMRLSAFQLQHTIPQSALSKASLAENATRVQRESKRGFQGITP